MFALFECCFVFIWFIYMLIKFLHFLVYFLFAFGQSIQLIAAFINTITNKISLSMLCLVCNVCFPSFRVVLLKITFLALSIFCIVLFHFLSALFFCQIYFNPYYLFSSYRQKCMYNVLHSSYDCQEKIIPYTDALHQIVASCTVRFVIFL